MGVVCNTLFVYYSVNLGCSSVSDHVVCHRKEQLGAMKV